MSTDYPCVYLGGNIQLDQKIKAFNSKMFGTEKFGHVFLRLDSDKINVLPGYPFMAKLASPNPIYYLEFSRISNIQNLPSERISALTTFVVGSVIAANFRKKEFCLVISFKDEVGFDQSLYFKIGADDLVYRAVYEKVVESRTKSV
jgi:hypothetical protein